MRLMAVLEAPSDAQSHQRLLLVRLHRGSVWESNALPTDGVLVVYGWPDRIESGSYD